MSARYYKFTLPQIGILSSYLLWINLVRLGFALLSFLQIRFRAFGRSMDSNFLVFRGSYSLQYLDRAQGF